MRAVLLTAVLLLLAAGAASVGSLRQILTSRGFECVEAYILPVQNSLRVSASFRAPALKATAVRNARARFLERWTLTGSLDRQNALINWATGRVWLRVQHRQVMRRPPARSR